jgi:hypothetical protein
VSDWTREPGCSGVISLRGNCRGASIGRGETGRIVGDVLGSTGGTGFFLVEEDVVGTGGEVERASKGDTNSNLLLRDGSPAVAS